MLTAFMTHVGVSLAYMLGVIGSGPTPMPAAHADDMDGVDISTPIQIQLKSLTLGAKTWNVAVVACKSYRAEGEGIVSRDMTHIYGADAGGESVFRIVKQNIAGSQSSTFTMPLLVSGWAYCHLESSVGHMRLKKELDEAVATKEALAFVAADRTMKDVHDQLDKRIEGLRARLMEGEKVMISIADPTAKDRAPWWPIVVTYFFDGGAAGTDILVQIVSADSNSTKLRIFLPEGSQGAELKYHNEGGKQAARLQKDHYVDLTAAGPHVNKTAGPAAATGALLSFMNEKASIFTGASGGASGSK